MRGGHRPSVPHVINQSGGQQESRIAPRLPGHADSLLGGMPVQSISPAQLGIVVVTYNSRDHVEHLAESLANALTAVGDIPVVFVDNASEDGTLDAVRQVLPNAIPVSSMSNDGYAAGINR